MQVGTAEWVVNDKNTAASMASGQLPVFATPALVALMEQAACNAIAETLEEGISTVGAQISDSSIVFFRPSKNMPFRQIFM